MFGPPLHRFGQKQRNHDELRSIIFDFSIQ